MNSSQKKIDAPEQPTSTPEIVKGDIIPTEVNNASDFSKLSFAQKQQIAKIMAHNDGIVKDKKF